MNAKIQDSFEYQAEAARQNFQGYTSAILEVHSDFQHKISTAVRNGKTGIWIEIDEAEIINRHLLESVANLMGSYEVLNNTNKILNVNYKAAQAIAQKDINSSIEDFKADRISIDEFSQRLSNFVGIRKPVVMKAI